MEKNHRYRQMAFFVDTCFGESVATNVTAPGILYLTGAAKNEPSLGAVYDMDIRQWLSDEFTSGVITTLRANGNITFRELYPAVYKKSDRLACPHDQYGKFRHRYTGYGVPETINRNFSPPFLLSCAWIHQK